MPRVPVVRRSKYTFFRNIQERTIAFYPEMVYFNQTKDLLQKEEKL